MKASLKGVAEARWVLLRQEAEVERTDSSGAAAADGLSERVAQTVVSKAL